MPTSSCVVRVTGATLLMLGGIMSGILYFCAPWSLDTMDFLIRPLVLFVAPVSIAGVSLLILPHQTHRKMRYSWIMVAIGSIGTLALLDWPREHSPYFWEDSYQTLAILEVGYQMLAVPLFICWYQIIRESVTAQR